MFPALPSRRPGSYRVWVKAWGAVAADGLTPQERTLAGVNFVLGGSSMLPEVQISGTTGAANWLWVEAQDANVINPGGPLFWDYDFLSGFYGTSPYLNDAVYQAGDNL